MQSSWTQPGLNLFGSILRSLLRKLSSQNSTNPSFPNVLIGNPERARTGPPDENILG